jgi:peptidoglycan/xylan/chitin deacetylase (PgdA/CDA1 family)
LWSLRAFVSRASSAFLARGRRTVLRLVGVPLGIVLVRAARLSARSSGVALVYHRIGDPPGDPRRELVPALGSRLFRRQVRHLVSYCQIVSAAELLPAVRRRRRGCPLPVAITFDDDLPSHLDTAAPILAEFGATATFFVSGASLHRPFRFWWERLQAATDRDLGSLDLQLGDHNRAIHAVALQIENLPPRERDDVAAKLGELLGADPEESGLRAEALERLARHNVEIGFHTRRHDRLPQLDDEQLLAAMRAGRSEIESAVGRPLSTISYPHGAADVRVAAAARAAGFEFGFTGRCEPVTANAEPLLLGRVSPSYYSAGELMFDVGLTLLRGVFRR